MRTLIETTPQMEAASPIDASPRSPWHSPVPYLFGGLAAMLGLIALALTILACSYWRFYNNNRENNSEDDLEKGCEKEVVGNKVYEEKILVIMAGDKNPTFIATPIMLTISSGNCSLSEKTSDTMEDGDHNNCDKNKDDDNVCHDHDRSTASTSDVEDENRETQ